MTLKKVKPIEIEGNPCKLIGDDWLLVCAGNKSKYNMMTAGWAGLGVLWSKPVCFVFIRPSRYTYEFIEENDYFSVNFFSKDGPVEKKYKKIMNKMGTNSGRDINKMDVDGLTPAEELGSVYFNDAQQVLICKKWYYQDLVPEQFLDSDIEKHYNGKDYHRMYVGEIVKTLKQ